MGNSNAKIPKPPGRNEQIRPEELARMMKKEKPGPGERLKDIPPVPKNYPKFQGEGRTGLPKGIFWALGGIIVLFIAGFAISFYVVKEKVKATVSGQIGALQAGVADLQNLDPQSAAQEFALLSSSSTPTLTGVAGMLGFLVKGGSQFVSSFSDVTNQLSTASQDLVLLEGQAFDFVSTGQGASFVAELGSLRGTLDAIDSDSTALAGAMSSIGSISNASSVTSVTGSYVPLKASVESASNFLDEFVPWMATSTPHHILILFDNTSEMRPGGGFLGSYADVTLAGGNITNIAVHDVADVDTAFHENIVPPPPLQLETTRFRPADANWFFDYPTSASETIDLFDASGLHANGSTTFDAAIAVAPKVVSDLLSVTGPITISSTKTAFTSDNLVTQIQSIVQQGQATSATYPKAVLGQLSQAIFRKLASSTDDQKQELLAMALDWVNKRDVMAYFANPDFESFFRGYGATGDVFQVSQNFNGDYLAIADADINSDKSELYVAQSVSWIAEINADGTITDSLTIDRTHNGNKSPSWWYKTTSQDYVQVFVPDGSSLTDASGGIKKTVPAPINYTKSGYSTDPLIAAIASTTQALFIYPQVTTHEEDGKEVFGTWSRVAAGSKTELTFSYTHRAFLSPADGTPYQFIFEKQAGSSRSYDFEIDAPLGYVFAETGLATYSYQSDDPPGRLVLNLTLQKL